MITDALTLKNYLTPIKRDYDELIVEFGASLQLADTTRATYIKGAKYFVKWLDANKIDDPTALDLNAYKNDLRATHESGTVNVYINAVKRFYDFLEQTYNIKNIAMRLKGTKTPKTHKKTSLSIEQVRALYACYEGDDEQNARNRAIIKVLINEGLRSIELVRANIADIKNLDGATVLYVQGKGKDTKDDFIKLNATAINAISEYLRIRQPKSNNEPLFTSISDRCKGERLQTRTVRNIFNKALDDCGIIADNITTHSTRHTAITLALLSGESLQEVQDFARHQNINTTLIYAHNLNKINSNVSNAIERMIKGA